MKAASAFWDSSALVPLCVHEAASRQAFACSRRFAPVVWWGSLVEIHSAIWRLYRERAFSEASREGALRRLRALRKGWREILPSDALRESALEWLNAYPLRAADSLQLAAAAVWSGQHPAGRTFISGDQRLAAAAETAGFSVIVLPIGKP